MPISNASPLIYLARLSKLRLLKEIYNQIQIPPEVKIETIDRGKAKKYPDAFTIEESFTEGWLIIHTLTDENIRKSKALMEMTGIDLGEAQVLMLAKQKNEREVLIDQSNVRKVAKYLGLLPRGTIFVILTAIKKNILTKENAKEILAKLIDVNFYLSAKTYRYALTAIEKL